MRRRRVKISDHARHEAARRGLAEHIILRVAQRPEQVVLIRPGREVRQSRLPLLPDGEIYLVRVVVDRFRSEEVVVTAYRTSKIEKYWAEP